MPNVTPLVLEEIAKTYGSGVSAVHAVRGVSLTVREGEIVAIVGPSGSGKTTLLSIAGCLLRPTSGRVVILGQDVTALSEGRLPEFRRRHIGYVFQAFNLLPALSARENIEIALNVAGVAGERAYGRARDLLALLEMTRHAERRPSDLSAGEQQRLAVGRALANRPDIILADEPTANLDSGTGRRVMELLRSAVEMREAKSLVIVTHDTRILDVAHRVLELEDGALRAEGSLAGGRP